MAPKKAAAAPKKAAPASGPAHASYQDMIKDAILNLKDRTGSSRQAIKKYIQANNDLPKSMTDTQFNTQISRALEKGEENKIFTRPKGPSGPVKLMKKADAAKTEEKPAKKEAKPAAKKEAKPKTATKAKSTVAKPRVAKKAAPKKTATKAAPKKASTKANTAKPRKQKTPTAAPAVVEEKPVVLGKTKSGRVTKSRNPAAAAPASKASGKKAPAAKKAAPKKSTTPKKKEEKKEESAA